MKADHPVRNLEYVGTIFCNVFFGKKYFYRFPVTVTVNVISLTWHFFSTIDVIPFFLTFREG